MTTRASSIKKNYFAPGFFVNTLKKSWTNFLLYFIVCFFTFPVPLLMSTQSDYYRGDEIVKFEYIVSRVVNLLEDFIVIGVFIAMAIAVFAGLSATKYLNSKTSAYFYHSLPVTREAMYITKILVGIIDYFAAFSLSMLIGSLVVLIRVGAAADITHALVTMCCYCTVIFLLIFFVTVFVGMFCGTGPVQFVMTGVALFIVPATFSSLILIAQEYTRYMDLDWYFEGFLPYSSPVIRMFYIYDDPLSVIEMIVFALLAAVFAFLAVLVYRKRGNENAGTPIVFPKVATFIKYVIMVPVTVFVGIWFGEMGGGFWQIFGFAAGAVLTFMLLNAILHKNARAMFKGVRGLIIFCAVFAICFVATVFDVLGLDEYIPSENLVSCVDIEINRNDYGTYYDKKLWKSLTDDLERHMNDTDESVGASAESSSVPRDYYYKYDEYGEVYVYESSQSIVCEDSISVRVVYHTKLGAPVAKYFSNIKKTDFSDTLRLVADSEEFEEQMYSFINYNIHDGYEELYLPALNDFIDRGYISKVDYEENLAAIMEAYKKDLGDVNYETFQSPQAGYIFKRVSDGKYYYSTRFYFPIFADSEHTLDVLLDGKDIYDVYIDSIHCINIYRVADETFDPTDKNMITVTDPVEMRAVLASLANLTDGYIDNVFTEYDYGYTVDIKYKNEGTYKEDGKFVTDEYYIGEVSYFIKDKIPAFVYDRLK